MRLDVWRPRSMRARLLLWLCVPLVMFLSVDAWTSYRLATRTAQLAFDRILITSAHALADLIRLERGRLVIALPHAALELYGDEREAGGERGLARSRMLYRVGFADGSYLAGDKELAAYTGRPGSHPVYGSMIELFDTAHGGEPLRMAALLQPVDSFDGTRLVVVQVAESSVPRLLLVRRILLESLARHSALLAVVVALIWLVSTLALKPLAALAARLESRSAHDLSALPAASVPRELEPVVVGFDHLLARLERAQEEQRRFVADASHQLRTPLAVLQLHADSGLRRDVPEREALTAIADSLVRARALAEQLLSLARARQAEVTEPERVDLRAVATDACVELSPLISAKYLAFQFECPHVELATHAWMIAEILKNLLRNAIEHTPAQGRLGLRITLVAHEVRLCVWDSGPGLSPAAREHLFQPFATHGGRGAGLGLAICKDLTEALRGRLELTDGPMGLEASLHLPL